MRLTDLFASLRNRRVPLDAIALIVLLNLGIGTAGWLYVRSYAASVLRGRLAQMEAIATLKLSQVDAWRSARLQDAWLFFDNTMISNAVQDLIRQPQSEKTRADLEPVLESILRRAPYESITIVGPGGETIMSMPRYAPALQPRARSFVVLMTRLKAPDISDPFLDGDGALRLLAVSPVINPSTGTPMGAVVITVDPISSLNPLVAGWPVPSRTAEALLVRERDGRVIFLTGLRYRTDTMLLSLPATGSNSLIARKAIRGIQGPVEGTDYRDIPVFATIRKISGLPWYLLVKMDRDEVAGETRAVSRVVLAGILVVALLLSAWLLVRWSRQTARFKAEEERLRTRLTRARELEAVALLAAGVAHDFNNILAGIGVTAEVLRSRLPDPVLREQAEKILSATKRAGYVVHGLLSFSEQKQVRSAPIELNGFLRDRRESFAHTLGPRVSVRIETSAAEILVQGDRDQFEDVLQHLVDNSRDAMPDGGTFTVRVEVRGPGHGIVDATGEKLRGKLACLMVSDTGVGMDEKTKKRVFEPFFTTKEFGKSAGIGLAAVYGIVRQHGGSIEVESAPGKGATFTIRFPLLGQIETTNRTIAP